MESNKPANYICVNYLYLCEDTGMSTGKFSGVRQHLTHMKLCINKQGVSIHSNH